MVAQRLVSDQAGPGEREFELTLRPRRLSEFIGQQKLKERLDVFLGAAKARGEPLEHVLLYGPPGLGKTTLAGIIANELGGSLRATSGPAIERPGDLAAILTRMGRGEVLFIDEIHRLSRAIEEILYSAMEDFVLDIVMGKGPGAQSLRLPLKRFTLVGATTRLAMVSAPLRDRFGETYGLEYYDVPALCQIVTRSASILNVEIEPEATLEIARRARGTPRVANRLLKRVRDFAQVRAEGRITLAVAEQGLAQLEVDRLGLDDADRKILKAIIEKFGGGPVGLDTIAAATSEEADTILDVYEPFLLQLGFIARTPRGRVATPLAYRHLGKHPPRRGDGQPSLFEEADSI